MIGSAAGRARARFWRPRWPERRLLPFSYSFGTGRHAALQHKSAVDQLQTNCGGFVRSRVAQMRQSMRWRNRDHHRVFALMVDGQFDQLVATPRCTQFVQVC